MQPIMGSRMRNELDMQPTPEINFRAMEDAPDKSGLEEKTGFSQCISGRPGIHPRAGNAGQYAMCLQMLTTDYRPLTTEIRSIIV